MTAKVLKFPPKATGPMSAAMSAPCAGAPVVAAYSNTLAAYGQPAAVHAWQAAPVVRRGFEVHRTGIADHLRTDKELLIAAAMAEKAAGATVH